MIDRAEMRRQIALDREREALYDSEPWRSDETYAQYNARLKLRTAEITYPPWCPCGEGSRHYHKNSYDPQDEGRR